MMNYHRQMKHPLWQKKRLEVLELHNYTCQECGDKETELHVHHPFYKRGAMIWDYTKEELMCLCNKCHADTHELDESLNKYMKSCSLNAKFMLKGFFNGLHVIEEQKNTKDIVCLGLPINNNENYVTHFKKGLVHAFNKIETVEELMSIYENTTLIKDADWASVAELEKYKISTKLKQVIRNKQ